MLYSDPQLQSLLGIKGFVDSLPWKHEELLAKAKEHPLDLKQLTLALSTREGTALGPPQATFTDTDLTNARYLKWTATFKNLLAGLDRPTSGTVTVDGQRIDTLSETAAARYRRMRIGMIFQFFNLLDDLTVAANVQLPAQLAGMGRAAARARAEEMLAALRIGQYKDAYPARLSGGQRQRVAIACALVNRPALLLADEPTGALDTATGEEIGQLLAGLNQSGQTLVLVTHNPDLRPATPAA